MQKQRKAPKKGNSPKIDERYDVLKYFPKKLRYNVDSPPEPPQQ